LLAQPHRVALSLYKLGDPRMAIDQPDELCRCSRYPVIDLLGVQALGFGDRSIDEAPALHLDRAVP
jgi:hypothetical protein